MAAADAPEPRATVRSVERAIDLLESLERAAQPQRLSELARSSGLSPSTALRLLTVLQHRSLVDVHDGAYSLGVAALGMGHGFLLGDPLVQRTRPILQQLSAASGLTASLYVRTGDERILVARADGRDPLRYQLPLGRRLPLHVGAGKTILAFAPADDRRRVLDALGDVRDAHGAPVLLEELEADLGRIASRGFHISVAERDTGVAAISVPVVGDDGAVRAAVSASGPSELVDVERLEALFPEMRRAAAAHSNR